MSHAKWTPMFLQRLVDGIYVVEGRIRTSASCQVTCCALGSMWKCWPGGAARQGAKGVFGGWREVCLALIGASSRLSGDPAFGTYAKYIDYKGRSGIGNFY